MNRDLLYLPKHCYAILPRSGELVTITRQDKILQVEISNGGPKSHETSVTLELPATWAGFMDAFQQARIKDSRHCKNEILLCRYKPLPTKLIGCNGNLLELNLLAQRLAMLRV